MTNLDYIIIEKIAKGVNTLKNIFYLTTGQAIIVYVFIGVSVIIYAINISKKVRKK